MATIQYTIQPGDTLWSIAQKYHTTVQAISRYNGIVDPNEISAGQTLRIEVQNTTAPPVSRWYIVQNGDSLFQIANKFNTTVQQIVDMNHIQDPNVIYPGQVLLIG